MARFNIELFMGPDDFDRREREEKRRGANERRLRAAHRCTCCGAPVECTAKGSLPAIAAAHQGNTVTPSMLKLALKAAKQDGELRSILMDVLQDDLIELIQILTGKDCDNDTRATRESPPSEDGQGAEVPGDDDQGGDDEESGF